MRAQSSTTSGWCIIVLASCARNISATHPPPQTPSATMAGRTANPWEREALTSHPHQHNCQQEVTMLISAKWEPGWRTQGRFQLLSGCFIGDTPAPLVQPWREPGIEGTTHQPDTYPHLKLSSHLDQMAPAFHQSRTI